jgi:hypothetical protein
MYCHMLASLGGSFTNFCRLGAKLPGGGYFREVKGNFSIYISKVCPYLHCGKIGHIQSSCFKLKSREHKNDSLYLRNSYEGLCNMMRVVLIKLDKLDKSHKTAPSVKKDWVRKVDTIHPLSGNGCSLT